MIVNRKAQVTAAVALLIGCSMQATYKDVSSEPAYRSLIGREIYVPSELLLHTVSLDRNEAKRVGLCSVTPSPGFDGPEVISRHVLPAGTTFRIMSVRMCTNCGAHSRPELIVASSLTEECGQAPIEISHSFLDSSVLLVPVAHGGAPNNSFKPKPLRGSE